MHFIETFRKSAKFGVTEADIATYTLAVTHFKRSHMFTFTCTNIITKVCPKGFKVSLVLSLDTTCLTLWHKMLVKK